MAIPAGLTSDELYMLGMLYGKGDIMITETGNECIFTFKIKYRRPSIDALRSDNVSVPRAMTTVSNITIEVSVFNEFNDLRRNIENILGVNVDLKPIVPRGRRISNGWEMKQMTLQTARMRTNSRILTRLFDVDLITHDTVQHIPSYLFDEDMPHNLILSFIQGFCDACGLPPSEVSAAYSGTGRQRVQLEPNWNRWYIPIEVCRLFQTRLNMRVNMINWGHPLIRGVNSYRSQNHQMRVWLDTITTNIFRLSFKREALESLIERRGTTSADDISYCPQHIRNRGFIIYRCNDHNEDDPDLPEELRNIHMDSPNKNIQICKLLGCPYCADFDFVERN